ncbi:MAG: uncharacterized protein JWP46_1187 [Modestobacter sp.]|nr:uncharacterized protein [Modestobacter sp.]
MTADALSVPDTAAARAAAEVAAAYYSPALLNHCRRSYLWAAEYGRQRGIVFDAELLYVAAMLHDIGLVPVFDSATAPFEEAGGEVAWVFAAGAGWPVARRRRAAEIVVRHMWAEVDPAMDAEGHLLKVATGLDITGRNADQWTADVRADVLERFPRLGLGEEFIRCFESQAERKPASSAAASVGRGLADGVRANVLDRA